MLRYTNLKHTQIEQIVERIIEHLGPLHVADRPTLATVSDRVKRRSEHRHLDSLYDTGLEAWHDGVNSVAHHEEDH